MDERTVSLYDNGNFLVSTTTVNGTWSVSVPGLAEKIYNLTARVAGIESGPFRFRMVWPFFDDLTDFENKTTGQWSISSVIKDNKYFQYYRLTGSYPPEFGTYTFLVMPTKPGSAGVALSRVFDNMITGARYRFSVYVWAYTLPTYVSCDLSLDVDGRAIVRRKISEDRFILLSADFVAEAPTVVLSVSNHENSGGPGNNIYHLDNLRVERLT